MRAIGITNQRETTVLWDRTTGDAVYRAIVWQSRQTAEVCARLKAAGHEPLFHERTGLVLDPYFSGSKIAWLLERDPSLRARAEAGEIAFGTIDTWLIHRLTGRPRARDRPHERLAHAPLRHPPRARGTPSSSRSSACRGRCCRR